MNNLKITVLISTLFAVSLASADYRVRPERNLDIRKPRSAFSQLEIEYKKNGSLMTSDRHALQAKLDRVSEAIRNFNAHKSSSFGSTPSVSPGQNEFNYVSDNPDSYFAKKP